MKYNNPPITEAVFDIKIDKLGVSDIGVIESLHKAVIMNFPQKKYKVGVRGAIEVEHSSGALTQKGSAFKEGLIFTSENETRQLQFRLNGFTYNVLKPYENWEKHFKEAWKYWIIYKENLKPNRVKRIATRFINRIELDSDIQQLENYFTTVPPVPKSLPSRMSNFFMQITVPIEEKNLDVNLTTTIAPKENKTLPFILDIDVYQIINDGYEDFSLKERFSILRTVKNEVFESCITDKTRQLFQ